MQSVLTTAACYRRFGRAATVRNLRRGLWQRPARGVIVTHNGPIDALARELVILAASQPGAALGGLSALAHDGLAGFPPAVTQVVLPHGARRPPLDDIQPHWSRFLDERDVHPLHNPRRTRIARSVIDAASWTPHQRFARAIVIAAVQQRLTSVRHLREALTRRGTCRHRALIVQSVLDAHGGIQSLPERDLTSVFAELGWRASRQRAVRGSDARYYLDAYVDDLGLGIEVHGIPHQAVHRWSEDLMRANEIVIAGERLMIFSSYAIRHERRAVIDQLRRFAEANAA